jgi:hypothetical protein
MENQDYIVKDDMICPVTKAHCDDECCPVGSICNMSSNDIVDCKSHFFSDDFKEKMEVKRKELDLKWEGWEENERERSGGGILILAAFLAAILALLSVLFYVGSNIK